MAIDPVSDSSGAGWVAPVLDYGLLWKDYGSYGLRQYSGWVREEFLPQLVGREASRVYREMLDNSATIGAIMFSIMQEMRRVTWHCEPANDSSEAQKLAEFAESLKDDMSHTWDDFIVECLSMLGFGFAPFETVYKKRLGQQPDPKPGQDPDDILPSSKYNDGRIGWRRLPIRGQETVLKWFFDENGQVKGLTQQPWVGTLIDIPIEKLLLFRPRVHKNNPEGRSVLRNCYRSYYFVTRLEELEAIMFERMNGFPVMYVPSSLMEKATAQGADPAAVAALASYKNLVTNVRVDEQMGMVLPSDTYRDADGKPSNVRMYQFEFLTPSSNIRADSDKIISRHKVDMVMSLLCDFIFMGHEVRGSNNLGTIKVDLFFQAIEGWLNVIADVLNRYALPRIWKLNGLNPDLLPKFMPDIAQRVNLDGLGTFVANLAAAGMPLFPDEELQMALRDAAGLPDVTSPEATAQAAAVATAQTKGRDGVEKMLKAAVAKEILKRRQKGE